MSTQRSAIIRTDAVVLRALDYGETSLIATLFTRERGKVGVMARGVRSPRSRFGSTLEPMAHVQAVIHVKPSRELQTLSEASHIRIRPRIGRSVDRLEPAMRSLELVDALMQSDQALPSVLDLLVSVLDVLDTSADTAADGAANAWPWFALHLASLLGLSPRVDRASLERIPDGGAWLMLETGTVSEERGTGEALRAGRAALRAFGISVRADLAAAMRMRMDAPVRHELDRLVDGYMRYHVEDAWPERAARVFGRMHEP
jgi:DNA repair protein RecO (recombination protein O)